MSYDLGTAHGKITLDYDGGGAARQAKDDIDDIGDKAKKSDRDVKDFSDSLKRLGSVVGSVLKVAGGAVAITGLTVGMVNGAVAAANFGVQIAGVIPALTSLLSLSAGLPALLLAGGAAALTLAAAFKGVGDAFSAALENDPAKFAEALEGLAPEAQNVAKAFQAMVPQINAVQQAIQNAFFQGLAPAVTALGAAFLPLGAQLVGIAADVNQGALAFAEFAAAPDTVSLVSDSIEILRSVLQSILPSVSPILEGLRAVGEVGLSVFDGLAGSVGDLAAKFADWLNGIASSGQLEGWIQTAMDTLGTLGEIATNVGGILSTIFQTAGETGGGLLNTIAMLTGQLDAFLSSAEGSAAIREIFSALGQTASALAPIFTTLVGIIGNTLGPVLAQVAQTVGPALLTVVQALGPAVAALAPGFTALASAIGQGLVALAPALEPLGQALGALATAAAPLAPLLGNLLAGALSVLAPIISVAAAEFGPMIDLMSQLAGGVIQQIIPPLLSLAETALPLAAEAGAALAEAFAPLVPAILEVTAAFVSGILPHLPELQSMMAELIPVMAQVAGIIGGALLDAFNQISPFIPDLARTVLILMGAFLQLAVAFAPALVGFAQMIAIGIRVLAFFASFMAFLEGMPARIIGFIASIDLSSLWQKFTDTFTSIMGSVTGFFASLFASFMALPGQIIGFLSGLPGMLFSFFTGALQQVAFAVGFGIGTVVNFFAQLPGRLVAAINALPGLISGVFRSLWSTVQSVVSSGISAVVSFFSQLPGRAVSAVSSIVGQVRSVFSNAMSAARDAVSSGVGAIISAFSSIPGRVSGLAGEMAAAGRNMISGAIGAIRDMAGAAADAAISVARAAVNGFKSALKISSPSRVMMEQGEFTVEGAIVGIRSMADEAKRAMEFVAGEMARVVPAALTPQTFVVPNSSLGTTIGATAPSTNVTFNQTVNAIPGMDAEEVATYAARRTALALFTGSQAVVLPAPSGG